MENTNPVHLGELMRPVRATYISSYIPRRCGLATFTKNLTEAMNSLNPMYPASILALDSPETQSVRYPPEVFFRVGENSEADFAHAADFVNTSNAAELLSLQHEFGIYGTRYGSRVLSFLSTVRKPVITTMHSVPAKANPLKRKIIHAIIDKSRFIVVMLDHARDILIDIYGAEPEKVLIIPHGVPDFPHFNTIYWKKKLDLQSKIIMCSVNLIAPTKGLQYAIKAIPEIVKTIPNFLYIVGGETHPVYLRKNNGKDLYREELKHLVSELGVSKHVRFVNKHLSDTELISYIGACDYYITPYLDPNQITSGGLATAIGAGKVCISTPYPYAENMLDGNRGALVPYRNSAAIASAVLTLHANPQIAHTLSENAYALGRQMSWVNVAHQYFHLFQQTLIPQPQTANPQA